MYNLIIIIIMFINKYEFSFYINKMYQSKKKQVRWQFEFQFSPEQIADKGQELPPLKITPIKPDNPILIQDVIKIQESNHKDAPQIQQVQKIPIPKHTKSKNYYVYNRDIYKLNDVEVCDFGCQYSPPRLGSKNYDQENNAHEYTIEKPISEGQKVPMLSAQGELDQFSKLNSEKAPNQLEGNQYQDQAPSFQDENIQCDISEKEKENILINKIIDMRDQMFEQRKNDPESHLIIQQLTAMIEQLQGVKENQQVVLSRLIEFMRSEVNQQNKKIAKQQELYEQEKQFKYRPNRLSVSSQTLKKSEVEQNELPKLLGYKAQSLEQDLEHNEYIATYQLKYGHAIITFKSITKLKQSEELNKIMQDFAEKFSNKQLNIVGLDLRINGVANNFFPYAELVQSVVTKRYTTQDGQIDKNYIPNIINLLPYMVKKLRGIEKQILMLKQYGILWTPLYPNAKIAILIGYRTILKQDHIKQDEIVLRIDYDLIEFRYEIQFDMSRLETLAPFYSKQFDMNYLQIGQQYPVGTPVYYKLLEIEETQGPISQIVRTINAEDLSQMLRNVNV
ncbi:hypothetical protein pb186bvf_007810 [Paramecium bursaria]